jgi:large subunit ribosomal protein L11
MAKKVVKQVKLQIPAGKANPAPPVGPALGQAGINIGDFVNKFNEATRDKMGSVIPVVISVYDDRSYDFICKTPPASNLILKKLGKEKGSGKNLVSKAGTLTMAQVKEIAAEKLPDLNTNNVDQAAKIIAGTARSMGVEVR